MKATTWLCPVLTLLCATKLVYTAQRVGSYGVYPLDEMDSQLLQNDYFRSKRNKPSLSIVNPLDVLRQRLLLEIARRQMKENSRQVELNRAILKNVGKRMVGKYTTPFNKALYEAQQEEQMQHEALPHMQPNYEYELIPSTLIFDYLQQQQRHPWLPYQANGIQFENNYINDAIEGAALSSSPLTSAEDNSGADSDNLDLVFFKGALDSNNDKRNQKHIKQSTLMNNENSAAVNEQHESSASASSSSFPKSISNRNVDDAKRLTLINNHNQLHPHHKNDLNLVLSEANPMTSNGNGNDDFKNDLSDNGGDYQIQRYLYHLHKNQNHLTRK